MAATGRPLSEFINGHRFQDMPYEVLKLGLSFHREELYRRIDLRVEVMLEAAGSMKWKGCSAATRRT